MNIFTFYCSIFSILCISETVICWHNSEMQMFDLVEELNVTFYQYLGVDGNATSSEIKRAYRKLSLLYHPDRNPNSEDALKFQKLVAIYEILKDDESRERYNDVLKFGLPDWRMPSYYFRKLRKMSFAESVILFAILSTAIHYACLWGSYFEQKWNMEAFLFRRKRKRNAESQFNEELNKGFRPRWSDILPLVIARFLYNLVVSTPKNVKTTCGLVKQEITTAIDKQFEQKRKIKAKEEERKKIEENKKLKKEKKQMLSNENKEKRKIYDIGIENAKTLPIETFEDIPVIDEVDKEENDELTIDPWTSKDTSAVIRSLIQFPAGVEDRWIKIHDSVKRPLQDIIEKIKEIQDDSKGGRIPISMMMQDCFETGIEEVIGDEETVSVDPYLMEDSDSWDSDEAVISYEKSYAKKKRERKKLAKKVTVSSVPIKKPEESEEQPAENKENETADCVDDSVVHQRKKPRKKTKYLETTEPTESVYWNLTEQKQFEEAIRAFPKGTIDRWDRIANKIPTKTKIECMERVKNLSTED